MKNEELLKCVCSLIEGFVEHVQCSVVVSSSGN